MRNNSADQSTEKRIYEKTLRRVSDDPSRQKVASYAVLSLADKTA